MMYRVIFGAAATSTLLWTSSKAASHLKISTFNRAFGPYRVVKDLKYTKGHEWVKVEGNIATIGITDYAQDYLPDVSYVDSPEVGEVPEDEDFIGVSSVKAVHYFDLPVSGKVIEVNEKLTTKPDLVNKSPYEEGWMIKVEMSDKNEVNSLMDSEQFAKYCEEVQRRLNSKSAYSP